VAAPIYASDLLGRIAAFPRVTLATLPTPLEEAPRLASTLGVDRIFVKRDDLTGLAFGGNKSRNYEFRLGEALGHGVDSVILYVDVLSNSQRQLAAAAARLGLETHLVLCGEQPSVLTGNLLVSRLLGANMTFVRTEGDQRAAAEAIRDRLAAQGHRPIVLNESPMFELAGVLAYAIAAIEITEQLDAAGVEPSSARIYMSSTGKGQAGLELALRTLGTGATVTGVAARDHGGNSAATVAELANETASKLDIDLVVDPCEVDNRETYVGPGYGIPSKQGNAALLMAARFAGLILDPVYTAKAFAALVDDARAGDFAPGLTPVFLHTGGSPMIFSFAETLLDAEANLDVGLSRGTLQRPSAGPAKTASTIKPMRP
jgi:1-aminocyclopropane-1-carboxylate deaminase/D-cysteine desulfhydrase-like pyridoxal-dependent ACC family enzyme